MKIGVFGVGHLGKIHLDCLLKTPFEIVGFYDPDPGVAAHISANYNIPRFHDEDSLIMSCDAIDIVTPPNEHYRISIKALKCGKHIFIEKPITNDLQEAKAIVDEVNKSGLIAQVGHVERYNPAFKSMLGTKLEPVFIEAHRLTKYSNRSADVSVILDLMIHDLDLITTMVRREVVDIQANGVNVINETPDICNARLTFAGGCTANITASRISMKNMRKVRIFQKNAYISLDLLNNKSQIITLKDQNDREDLIPVATKAGEKYISISNPMIKNSNAIVEELNDFYYAIKNNTSPKVNAGDGYKVLALAKRIEEVVKSNLS